MLTRRDRKLWPFRLLFANRCGLRGLTRPDACDSLWTVSLALLLFKREPSRRAVLGRGDSNLPWISLVDAARAAPVAPPSWLRSYSRRGDQRVKTTSLPRLFANAAL